MEANRYLWRALAEGCKNLTPVQKSVLLCIAHYCDDKGHAYPKQSTIAAVVCCGRQAVSDAMRHLRSIGLVRSEKAKRDDGGNSSNDYWLRWDGLIEWIKAHGSAVPAVAKMLATHVVSGDTPMSSQATYHVVSGDTPMSSQATPRTIRPNEPLIEQEPPNPPKNKKPKEAFVAESVALPASLDTEQFRAAWSDWCQHRREIGRRLTPKCVQAQLANCESWGLEQAIESIRDSIAHGWRGLFPPKQRTNGGATNGRTQHLRSDRKGRHIRKDGYYERIAADRGWTYASAARESESPASEGR